MSSDAKMVALAPTGGAAQLPRIGGAAPGGPGFGRPIAVGVVILAIFFGVFGGWAATARLDAAAIAMGIVGVESRRKTIQHLEGGIIQRIVVRDGDTVRTGDILIVLDDTRARATQDLLRGRSDATQALVARLTAERDSLAQIAFPAELTDRADNPDVATILRSQENIFDTRHRATVGQAAILEQRIAQLEEETKGLAGEIRAEERQLALIGEEVGVVEKLVADGLARRPRLLALQRKAAEIEGSRSQNRAAIARINQAIAESRLRISELETAFLNEVVQQLRDAQSALFDLIERRRAADDVLTRTLVRAPLAGTIVAQRVFTQGGVIQPGEPLLDIVPSEESLIVEAQIDPSDIDVVRPGLPALIRLTALSMRTTPPIRAEVVSVSADRLTDQRSNTDYFLARVELREDPADVLDGTTMSPGMQAEVMIVTGARTPLQYLLQPAWRALNRAFREP